MPVLQAVILRVKQFLSCKLKTTYSKMFNSFKQLLKNNIYILHAIYLIIHQKCLKLSGMVLVSIQTNIHVDTKENDCVFITL